MSWAEDNIYEGFWPDDTTNPLWFRTFEWTTKEGNIVKLKDMSERHLFNSYNKCTDSDMQEAMMKEMTYRLFWARTESAERSLR